MYELNLHAPSEPLQSQIVSTSRCELKVFSMQVPSKRQKTPMPQQEKPIPQQETLTALQELNLDSPRHPRSTFGSYTDEDALSDSHYDEAYNAQSAYYAGIAQSVSLQDDYPLHGSHALDPYSQEEPGAPAFALLPFEVPPSPGPFGSTSSSYNDVEADADSAYNEIFSAQTATPANTPRSAPLQPDVCPSRSTSGSYVGVDANSEIDSAYDEAHNTQSAYHASNMQYAPLQPDECPSALATSHVKTPWSAPLQRDAYPSAAGGSYIAYPFHGSYAPDPYSPGQPAGPGFTLFPFKIPSSGVMPALEEATSSAA